MITNRSADYIGGSVSGMNLSPNEKATVKRQLLAGLFNALNSETAKKWSERFERAINWMREHGTDLFGISYDPDYERHHDDAVA